MPNIEVDETQLVTLQRNSALLAKALQNSASREGLLRALKTANPELPIPEIDAKEPVLEEIKKISTRLDDFNSKLTDIESKREEEKQRAILAAKWDKGRKTAQAEGYVGEALDALEKFMEERGVAEHEIAIPAFERLHPPEKPVESTSTKFDFFDKGRQPDNKLMEDYMKGGATDERLFDAVVGDVLKQARGLAA